jgi:hypothetical protein
MSFGSPKAKPSWFKVMKFGLSLKLAKKRLDYCIEKSVKSVSLDSKSCSDINSIENDSNSLVTANVKIESVKHELNYPLKNLLNNRLMTAKEVLPKSFFEGPNLRFKTPIQMDTQYKKWFKSTARDREYWHMNKGAYIGKIPKIHF